MTEPATAKNGGTAPVPSNDAPQLDPAKPIYFAVDQSLMEDTIDLLGEMPAKQSMKVLQRLMGVPRFQQPEE